MEEINYDIMRYDLDNEGYVCNVYFGCSSGTCVGYTGEIPENYETLEQWAENANIRAYKIVDGNLVFDANRDYKLKVLYEQEDNDNAHITKKEMGMASTEEINPYTDLFPSHQSSGGYIVGVDETFNRVGNLPTEEVNLSLLETQDLDLIELEFIGNNFLPNTATSSVNNGIAYTQNKDKTIKISGTATDKSTLNLAGTDTSVRNILTFKGSMKVINDEGETIEEPTNYLLFGLADGVSLEFYKYDGSDRTLVGIYNGGVISFEEDTNVTQVVLVVDKGITIDTTIKPMLQLVGLEYPILPMIKYVGNLFNYEDTSLVSSCVTTDDEGWITIVYDNTNGTSEIFADYYTKISDLLKETKTYKAVLEIKDFSQSDTSKSSYLNIIGNETSTQFKTSKVIRFREMSSGVFVYDMVTKETFENSTLMTRNFVAISSGDSVSITFRLSILEDTTITSDTFEYKVYNGRNGQYYVDGASIQEKRNGYNLVDLTPLTEDKLIGSSGFSTSEFIYDETLKRNVYHGARTSAQGVTYPQTRFSLPVTRFDPTNKNLAIVFRYRTVGELVATIGEGAWIGFNGRNNWETVGINSFNYVKDVFLKQSEDWTIGYMRISKDNTEYENYSTSYSYMDICLGSSAKDIEIFVSDIMVVEITDDEYNATIYTPPSFEQYGVSPSPDYPSEIINIYKAGTYNVVADNKIFKFTLSEDLRSLPSGVADRLWFDVNGNNGIDIERKVKTLILSGTDVTLIDSYTNIAYAQIAKPNDFVGKGNFNYQSLLCSCATETNDVSVWDSANKINKITAQPSINVIWIGLLKGTTLEEIQTKLDGATIQYELAEYTTSYIPEYSGNEYEYEEYKNNTTLIDLAGNEFTVADDINIKNNQIILIKNNGEEIYLGDTVMPRTYTPYTHAYCHQKVYIGFKYKDPRNVDITKINLKGLISITDIETEYNFNSDDLTKIQNYIMETGTLTEEEIELYDVNGDGVISSSDYVLIKNMINGVISNKITGTLEINSTQSKRTIVLRDSEGKIKTSLGLNGATTPSLSTEQLILGGIKQPKIMSGTSLPEEVTDGAVFLLYDE